MNPLTGAFNFSVAEADLIPRLDEWILEQRLQEYSERTLKSYRYSVQRFIDWIPEDEEITKETMLRYKADLMQKYGSPKSINCRVIELNKFMKWMELSDLKLKKVKVQFKQSNEDVLSIADYKRLLRFAKRNNDHQLYFIMKILAMTGIRVSELRYFTVENLKTNYIKVFNKSKFRTVIVRQDLMRELKRYAREHGIKKGILFPSTVKPSQMVDESTIWRHMKKIAGQARVKKEKVHAHSFRHLFAQIYLETYTDSITELADILGHESLETTRLYTRTSDAQKRAKLERMDFVGKEKNHERYE